MVKEFCFLARGVCGTFFLKFLAAAFPGKVRTKIGKTYRQIFATLFANVGERFSPEFRSRDFRGA